MNNKYKSTADVAKELEPGSLDFRSAQVFDGSQEEAVEYSNLVRTGLENPECIIQEVSDGFSQMCAPTVLFNLLGNSRDYNYKWDKEFSSKEVTEAMAILTEEVNELRAALADNNKPEIIDAICDVIVVAIGIALKSGMMMETINAFSLVSHNNLLKLKETEDGVFYAERKDGKIQKPEGFQNLNLSTIFTHLTK